MRHTEDTFESHEGFKLFEQSFTPDEGADAAIVIVHGYAEHSSRYGHVSECFVKMGYAACMFDLRGHGRSEGTRAFVNSFDEYLSDLDIFLDRVRGRKEWEKIFILGHSLGGTIAALYAITRSPGVRGLILSAPFLALPEDVTPFEIRLMTFLNRILPRLKAGRGIDSKFLSHDPEARKLYEEDPLIYHGKMRVREAAEIKRAVELIEKGADGIDIPVLILHGTADKISPPAASVKMYERLPSPDKKIKLYDGLYHELMSEYARDQVVSDIEEWTNRRL